MNSMKISRQFSVKLSELKLEDGENVFDKLGYIKRWSIKLGQELSFMRQKKERSESGEPVLIELSSDDYEELECMCWGILSAVEMMMQE